MKIATTAGKLVLDLDPRPGEHVDCFVAAPRAIGEKLDLPWLADFRKTAP